MPTFVITELAKVSGSLAAAGRSRDSGGTVVKDADLAVAVSSISFVSAWDFGA